MSRQQVRFGYRVVFETLVPFVHLPLHGAVLLGADFTLPEIVQRCLSSCLSKFRGVESWSGLGGGDGRAD